MEINEFSKKQWDIFDFAADENTYLICDGAIRSGKTFPMSIVFIYSAMLNYDKTKFAICSKTTGAAERNIIDPLFANPEVLPGVRLKYNHSTHTLEARHLIHRKTNTFHIFGGNDTKSYTKIQGLTAAAILFDEVALQDKLFVRQAIGRVQSFPKAKIWFNCNPEGPAHWFYQEYIKEKKPRTKYLHFVMEDNPIMGKEQIERANSMFSGVFHKRYIQGLWAVAEGAIYSVFTEKHEKYFVDTVPYIYNLPINVGLDFGGNKSRHALTATAINFATNDLYVLRSESFKAEGVSPEQLYQIVRDFLARIQNQFGMVSTIYADSAEQTLINGLKSRVGVSVRNSIKNPINDRIRCVTGLMGAGRFHMIERNCKDLIEAFDAAVWNDKTIVKDERLDDGSYNVDILDSLEYSFERYLRQLSREPQRCDIFYGI